ncbi:MAG: ABC transporter substrate-binding protein [Clostridia bacterium]|nr:ABC transporter substrate-binding protein [Clostridia bacterium]
MKKLISLLCAVLLLVAICSGCSATNSTTPITVRVAAIQGPTGIGMVHLMDAAANNSTAVTYDFSVSSAPTEVGPKLTNGDIDIAALPTNMAATLYNKTSGNIRLLAVNTLGVLYMLENGNTIQSVADLRGKTIYTSGQGANPEYVLNYVLKQNGIDPTTDVTIKFVAENTELATLMLKGDATVAMVPQPVVSSITAQNGDIRIALSMNDAWEAVAGEENKLMMGCVAVRKEFLENHPKEVETFLSEYKTAIEKTSDVDTTAALCEEYGIIPKAAIAKKAIPYCELTFVSGTTMKEQIAKYYSVLFESNPQSIGGKLPDEAFYYAG